MKTNLHNEKAKALLVYFLAFILGWSFWMFMLLLDLLEKVFIEGD